MASKRKMKMKKCMVEDTNNQLRESHSIRIIIQIYKLSIKTISFCRFLKHGLASISYQKFCKEYFGY